jgi:hypothetical protein
MIKDIDIKTDISGKWVSIENVYLLLAQVAERDKELSHELLGVIIDTEEGDGFDDVCLNTVKRVHSALIGIKK